MWLTLFQDRVRAASTTGSEFGNHSSSENTPLMPATVAAAPATPNNVKVHLKCYQDPVN